MTAPSSCHGTADPRNQQAPGSPGAGKHWQWPPSLPFGSRSRSHACSLAQGRCAYHLDLFPTTSLVRLSHHHGHHHPRSTIHGACGISTQCRCSSSGVRSQRCSLRSGSPRAPAQVCPRTRTSPLYSCPAALARRDKRIPSHSRVSPLQPGTLSSRYHELLIPGRGDGAGPADPGKLPAPRPPAVDRNCPAGRSSTSLRPSRST